MLHIHRPRPQIALLALASFVIFLFALLVGGDVLARRHAAPTPEASTIEREAARPELPREWQWKRKPVRFDGMYRAM